MDRKNPTRREFLGTGLGAAATATIIGGTANAAGVTAPVAEGPFYPVHEQSERDADLTRFNGAAERAEGELVIVEGQVKDDQGNPVPGALVDVWQANAAGRYHHELDTNTAPRDPNFQVWAQIIADEKGHYRFLTVKPGAYPVNDTWSRPPHIHFMVSKRGHHELTTQMFFEGEPLNDVDALFLELSKEGQSSVLAKSSAGETKDGEAAMHCRFDVVLKKA